MNSFAPLAETTQTPPPVRRPALALWLWERGLDLRQAGDLFGVSHMTVAGWIRPFDDPSRTVPRAAAAARVAAVTEGAIPPDSFTAPGPAAEPAG